MIEFLTGRIHELKPTGLILIVNGVGYGIKIPLTTFEAIKGQTEISLRIYTLHREDQFKLFGFHSENEKSLFEMLLGISGIGPSMALSILSGISPERLRDSVNSGNVSALISIPGIGKNKAEKLIFELRRHLDKLDKFTSMQDNTNSGAGDAIEALVSLGFDEKKSAAVINGLLCQGSHMQIEDLIKEALKIMSS